MMNSQAYNSVKLTTQDGLSISLYELGGSGPSLLIVHATGFHGRTYLKLARQLREYFTVYAIDERGHGDSGAPDDLDFSWEGFATDVLCATKYIEDQFHETHDKQGATDNDLDLPGDAHNRRSVIGFGHSAGAAALLLAEQRHPGTFRALYLYEPVMFPAPEPLGRDPNNFLAVGARRRRETFTSYDDALNNFLSKGPFAGLDPEVLNDYVTYGFRQDPAGTVSLKCLRANEALVYEFGSAHWAFQNLNKVSCKVVLSCGQDTNAFGPAIIDEFSKRIPNSAVVVEPGLGHFGPLESPQQIANSIINSLGRLDSR